MALGSPLTAVVSADGTQVIITISGFNGGAGYTYTGGNAPTFTVTGAGANSQNTNRTLASQSEAVNGADLDITVTMSGVIYKGKTVVSVVAADWVRDVGNAADNLAALTLSTSNNSDVDPPNGGIAALAPMIMAMNR